MYNFEYRTVLPFIKNMKKIAPYILLFMSMCLFTACPSDDDENKSDNIIPERDDLISMIEIYEKGNEKEPSQTIKFYYGDNDRVIAADYSGKQLVCGPVGQRVHFNVNGQILTLTFSKVGFSSNQHQGDRDGEGYGEGILNDMGFLETSFIDATQREIKDGDYYVDTYEHNNKGQLTTHLLNSRKVCSYTWKNDCLNSVSGNPGGVGYSNPIGYYSNVENKANINVNWLIFDQIFQEDIFGLTLCGYMSTKDKYLLEGWKINENGYPALYRGKYTYVIIYGGYEQNIINGESRAVDLGLSVYWANCNVGAVSPELIGSSFAWGETATKTSYTKKNYNAWKNKDWSSVPESICGTEWDAATVNWGNKWRMPTRNEFIELINNCIVTWAIKNGEKGYNFQSSNGKSIFIPINYSRTNFTTNPTTTCWTGEKDNVDGNAIAFGGFGGFLGDQFIGQEIGKPFCSAHQPSYCGLPVRPVMDK